MKYSLIEIMEIAGIDERSERIRQLTQYLNSCIQDARVYTQMDTISDYLSTPKLQESMKLNATKAIAYFLMEKGFIDYDLVKEEFGRGTLVASLKVVL
jgi:hypothetical protein